MARYNPRKETSYSRRISSRDVKQTFLIVCEGQNTEPDYFNAFRLTSANVKAIGKGMNTMQLVKEAIIIKEQENKRGRTYNQHWVVFDKDDFSAKDFNDAIALAEANGFQVAYSNQAFEYWILLHYNLYEGRIHRNDYPTMLTKAMGVKYSKDADFTAKLYNRILFGQDNAIKRAKHVMEGFDEVSPAMAESSTMVYKLVEELNKYL